MPFRISHSPFRLLGLIALLIAGVQPIVGQADPAADLLSRINSLRTQNGLLPLAASPQLTAAAQRHSSDMAATGNIDHVGSDGSTYDARIKAAGYGHWRGFGIWGENIYGGQSATVDVAWNFWINSQVHRSNLVNTRYREIGIGVGTSDKGTFFTLNFGAQPNVLPFFVSGSAPDVTLLLTNENDITTGDGVSIMGQATEIRAGESTDLSNLGWQPWAEQILFHLSDAPGPHTITVEYRDELKRGTKYSVMVNPAALAPATDTPSPTATSKATTTRTPTAAASSTRAPTLTATASVPPTETPTAIATSTTSAPTSTPTPLPSSTPTLASTDTPTVEPTTTPTVKATPTPPIVSSPTATPQAIAVIFPTSISASRLTPPAPQPQPTDQPLIALTTGAPDNLFAVVCGLQAAALIMGAVIVVMRVRSVKRKV